VTEDDIRDSFADLVVSENMFHRLGAAINSGKPIFLYGPAGGGKTTIAECIGRCLPGKIYLPYSVLVGGQIIVVYDEVNHRALEPSSGEDEEAFDQRWVPVKRPIIGTGGEMTLKTLDLDFNPNSKYYEAPLQMKASNGVFIVDDFGRQIVDPQALLNRWIVPLDRRVDFLSLHTGMKFQIPFDQLVIFATNLEPQKLADEAFLRRLRYKIKINFPTPREYKQIFQAVCDANQLSLDDQVFEHLIAKYDDSGIKPIGCHPRDLVDHIIDEAYFMGKPPAVTRDAIDFAWTSYFVDA
jgi:predicted ATPase with chaperone activity